MVRIAVIDDHVVVRTGLRYIIESVPDFAFAGDFAGGEGAAEFILGAKCDVALLDVRMPGKSGVEVLREVMAADPKAKVVMLTTSDAEEDVFRSIELGALGYVMKDSPVETIVAAVKSALAGEVFMTDDVRAIYESRKGMKGLSPREAEVIAACAKGLGNREIGEKLGISENSVKMHLKRAFFKLGAGDRAEAVTLAHQRGMIPSVTPGRTGAR